MPDPLPFLRQIGTAPVEALEAITRDCRRAGCLYGAVMDVGGMGDPATLDLLVREFPARLLAENDVYLILIECLANALRHGKAEGLGLSVRQRSRLLLVSFFQTPPMPDGVRLALERGRAGWLPDLETGPTGGLGFPILSRISDRITVGQDSRRLQLWFRLKRLRREHSPL